MAYVVVGSAGLIGMLLLGKRQLHRVWTAHAPALRQRLGGGLKRSRP